ncbi:hypothetical protein MHBO_002173 [Bonamia ostreae]|uniref:Uncharacterized protein n=1 Tax=Bonamia ostreae TaxID=126728 RepID=A0ABV2ALF4_9EUKA
MQLTDPFGLTNAFMAVSPKHQFFHFLIEEVVNSDVGYLFPYPSIMFSTGPMFLNRAYWRYFYRRQIIVMPQKYFLTILKKTRGSTWHRWDARVVMFFYNSWRLLAVSIIFAIFFVYLLVVCCFSRIGAF